jgi:hypothetical protein
MIAPALQRAPRMLLVIGEDQQGLPTETLILEPSLAQLLDALRARLAAVLPNWLVRVLGLDRIAHRSLVTASEAVLIDARLRWAGL